MRWSYLPPLMVYLAAGIQGLTGIVGTFFIKDYLGLSAEFLAALGFWAGIPWALKMPIGHWVDVIWRYKSWLIVLGAFLIALSLSIMATLIGSRDLLTPWASANTWFVWSALLAPIGYVLQDAVADAMTVEAVPHAQDNGQPFGEEELKSMHTTMQTLGRVAIIGGTVLVALLNLFLFSGTENLPEAERVLLYERVYWMALSIPVISVSGVLLHLLIQRRKQPHSSAVPSNPPVRPNPWILGGSALFAGFTVVMGLSEWRYAQELIFMGSLGIIGFLMARLMRELTPTARTTLLGTALMIFLFRATPSAGPGVSWWMIDELGFDPPFFSKLSLIGSVLTLLGMFMFRRFMAERPMWHVIVFLTLAGAVLSLPFLGMSMGLHHYTAALTGGVVDARFIALIDTALESPLGQISMIPMLAWIANSAPQHLKATYFAVMASFTNLALSASSLGTKYLNQFFVIERASKDPQTLQLVTQANYADLTSLLVWTLLLGLLLPLLGIALARVLGWRST